MESVWNEWKQMSGGVPEERIHLRKIKGGYGMKVSKRSQITTFTTWKTLKVINSGSGRWLESRKKIQCCDKVAYLAG